MNGQNDIGDIVSKLTENPEMMKMLMGVAGNIMNGNGDQFHPKGDKRDTREEHGVDRDAKDCVDHVEKGCDSFPKKEKRGDDAENLIRLLIALKPYVGSERCGKIDNIIKILKLIQLSEKTGLLKSLL